MRLFREKDEREKTIGAIAIRYTFLLVILTLFVIIVVQGIYENISILYPVNLFGNYHINIYISESIKQNFVFIMSTQVLILFASEMIINRRSGGERKPIVSGDWKFRFMDERERMISDKSIAISLYFVIAYPFVWAIADLVLDKTFGLPAVMVILNLIFYIIVRFVTLVQLGG
ncbi:hypothetical protein AB8U03_07625 [Clostridium sp. Mt-5]|uniref:Uncharacterized protein n=1 Tax=Clostridium moutaii TaxID=3240932 RepID=A0ABV4BPA4_9CLOT